MEWGFTKRIAFRFVFIYLLLYLYLPGNESIWASIVVPVNDYFFHLNVSTEINGSGDTPFYYVHVVCLMAISVLGTALWSILDRKRKNYDRLYQWLFFLTRLALGMTMWSYGFAKIFPGQFGPGITLYDLVSPLGESSPMGLLWRFMAASRPYTIFTGVAEVAAAICLFIPRLTLAGALLNAGIMLNIFMLNLSYDVPVKLYSFHLLLFSLFIAGKDFHRLAHLLPVHSVQLFKRKWANRIAIFLPSSLIAYSLVVTTYYTSQMSSDRDHPLRGIWMPENPEMNRLILEPPYWIAMELTPGEWKRYEFTLDEIKNELAFNEKVAVFKLEGDELELDGNRFHRKDESSFTLLGRGFHWINEIPYNR